MIKAIPGQKVFCVRDRLYSDVCPTCKSASTKIEPTISEHTIVAIYSKIEKGDVVTDYYIERPGTIGTYYDDGTVKAGNELIDEKDFFLLYEEALKEFEIKKSNADTQT